MVDAINICSIAFDSIKHRILMTPKMDCPVTQSPESGIFAELQTTGYMGKPVKRIFHVVYNIRCSLLTFELV